MKLKEFFAMADEGVNVYIAIQVEGLESYLFSSEAAFSKKDIEKTGLANCKILEFRIWHGYFTVVVGR